MNGFSLKTALVLLLVIGFASAPHVSGNEVTPIKHIIVVMQENHSFDNYFGTYPTANGSLVNSITSHLHPVDGLPNGICLPLRATCVRPYFSNTSYPMNPVEGQIIYEQDYAAGKMDGFAESSGPQSMAYFDYRQIAAYWDYAEEYGLADRYFASALSTTTPNRLFLLAGDTPVSNNYGPPPYLDYAQTILGEMETHGVSWGYFDFVKAYGSPGNVYPLNYAPGLNGTVENRVEDVSVLFQYLRTGSGLPAVSFVNSLGSDGLDEHPPENVTRGELWVVSVVNAVMSSAYWDSSAILVTWDEGGGYYDHVAPPQLLRIDHGFDHPLSGYGQRVPLLVISPYAKENYVSETVLNHMSIIRFIEYNWNLPILNQNILGSNNLLEFFDFGGPGRSPIILGDTGNYSSTAYPIPMQASSNQITLERTSQVSAPWEWIIMSAIIVIVLLWVFVKKRALSILNWKDPKI